MVKNEINSGCLETSRKVQDLSVTNNSIEDCQLHQAKEYSDLLHKITDDILNTKFDYNNKIDYLYKKVNLQNNFGMKDELIEREVQRVKKSEGFINTVNEFVDERVQERLPVKVEEILEVERAKMRKEFESAYERRVI